MPTLDVSYRDLCNLIGKDISEEEIKTRAIMFAKGEIDEFTQDGDIKVDEKDTNRPDLWSTEGLAREIAGRYGKEGAPKYQTEESGLRVKVDPNVKDIRPFTVCAVVSNINITENMLIQMIQLQEKVSGTYGRNRDAVAIGIYDYNKIKGNVNYRGYKPDELSFVPLDSDKEMKLSEILKEHPKGKEFAHLLEGKKLYPIFIDDKDEVLSMPPVINSDYTGKVTENTTNLFIECSGWDPEVLKPALNVLVCALADRGGKIQTVDIVYGNETIKTPDLSPKKRTVKKSLIKKVTGMNLDESKIKGILSKSRYDVLNISKDEIEVAYPAYRQDIMHDRDVIEDMLITMGYNEIKPEPVKMETKSGLLPENRVLEKCSEVMVGLGFQEILSYTLTNKDNLFRKMEQKEEEICELDNPVSMNWSVFRNRLLPALLDFFESNKHHEMPQKVFETGTCIVPDDKSETRFKDDNKLACAMTSSRVTYEEISSVLDAFMRTMGFGYSLKKEDNPSYIKGRCAGIYSGKGLIGHVGEISPKVLVNRGLENPVIGFEVDLDEIKK